MRSTSNRRTSVAELLRFKATQTLDSLSYIKIYSEALETYLEVNQRQTFFMIAKILTDGTISLHKNRSRLADYYFNLADRYISQIPSDQINQKHFIDNVYGRSKSFHLFKLGKINETIDLVHKCLNKTIELEKKDGLEFLILDRISQYDNLSRVLFATNNAKGGYAILSDCIIFLMTGKDNEKRKLHNKYLEGNNEDYHGMRSFLLYKMFTTIIESLLKVNSKEEFLSVSTPLLDPIIDNIESIISHTEIDNKIKNWLEIVRLFYSNDILKFKNLAIQYINSPSIEKDKKLEDLMNSFFAYC